MVDFTGDELAEAVRGTCADALAGILQGKLWAVVVPIVSLDNDFGRPDLAAAIDALATATGMGRPGWERGE